ncbi:hypothetical protein pipiens_009111 [Culex pipiens pipiens]|uniref:CCDC174 alpha/beta GRSR domain-containing protein n=1 Tax=Culex pipiens pipiens TaxID=38569 RepID=A0ABD1DF02_CULPP
MNDPNKKIEIDKSSLLSLKAELLRKQEEVSRAKTSTSIDDFVPKRVPKAPESSHPPSSGAKSRGKSSKSSASGSDGKGKVVELEDSAQLDRSKKVLLAKSKYYDRMMASGGALNSDENCLVMFNQKKQTDRVVSYRYSSEEESDPSSSDEEDRRGAKNRLPERDDDLVEYTDYLGRSRKCPRKELDEMLRKDREMEREARASRGEEPSSSSGGGPGPAASLRDDNSDEDELIGPPVPSVAITEDTIGERFREMREQWTRQEAANMEKDSVHYSDVLFDEARQHGVGYYGFSTDRDERNRQQLELDAIREATVDAQREKEDLRAARDRIIADRVRAAKARQRARLGLPPEEEEKKQKGDPEVGRDELYDTEEERKRAKAEAKAKKKREKEERRRDRERKGHVRPWDEGKEQDGDSREWKPAKEWRVMSQEEWNEMQRKERNAEFAPPVDYGGPPRWERNPLLATQNNPRIDEAEQDADESDEEEQIGPLPPTGYAQGMDYNPLLMPPPTTSGGGAEPEEISMPSIPGMEDIFLPEAPPTRALFFTTKKKEFKRRNYETTAETAEKRPNLEQQQHRVPIRNELSEDEEEKKEEEVQRGKGVEIAPPPTFDYYGPTTGKAAKAPRKPPVSKTTLEASIEAGLKFLRNQSDKAGPSGGTKNRWTSNADY